jgi:hypothetical protein
LKTPPDQTLVHNAAPEAKIPTTVCSPESGQGSDPEFPLNLIVSPEPSLTEGMSRPKSRPSLSSASGTAVERITLTRMPLVWLWGLFALTFTVLVVVAILAVFDPFGDKKGNLKPSLPDVAKNPKSVPKSSQITKVTPSDPNSESGIVVRIEGENEIPFAADKLSDAINKAIGSHGWVELRNRKPLRVTGTNQKPLDFDQASGQLMIRAAEGSTPVIEFEMTGSKPLLATGSAVTVLLSGVTIVMRYAEPATLPSANLSALISLAGKSKIERCAFKLEAPSQPKGCCALLSNMGPLEVDRCWFEGFDKAIEVAAGFMTEIRVSQTMIVPAIRRAPLQAQPDDWYGWGVKFDFSADIRPPTSGVQPKPNLILNHCTVEGAGFLDLTSSRGPAPIQLAINQCAFRTNALLAFNSDRPQEQQQIQWVGAANQYDILGRSWIVHSTEGSPAFSTDVTDLESWLRFAPAEKKTIRSKLKYQIDPSARSLPPGPRDFAVEAISPSEPCPGADPRLVGPWSKP